MQIGQRTRGSMVAAVLLLATALANCNGSPRQESATQAALALLDYPNRAIIDPFEQEGKRFELRFDFIVNWVSADGSWIGGRTEADIFHPTPPCLFLQNVKTTKKNSYCGLVRQVDRFAFSSDFTFLAVLGIPDFEANTVHSRGLFLIDLANPGKEPVTILRDLQKTYISGLSFTRDGRWLVFGRATDVLAYDRLNGELKSLANGTRPAISPNSTHLIYEDSSGWLILKDIKTGVESTIGETTGVSATWSPAGDRIVYSRPIEDVLGNNAEVVVYDLKTRRNEVCGKVYTLGDKYWWVIR